MDVYYVGVHSLRDKEDRIDYMNIHSELRDGVYPLTDSQKPKIDWIAMKKLVQGHL